MGETQLTEERIRKLLALEAKQEKVRADWRRNRAEVKIILIKAKAAGITASEEEIDRELERLDNRKK